MKLCLAVSEKLLEGVCRGFVDQLECQYCGETGILQVQILNTLSWASFSLVEQPFHAPLFI